MNIFRFTGDMLHIVSICLILLRMLKQKTCAGLSKKTQIAYCIVFTLRYIDLFTNFYSLYNTVLKVLFIASSYWIWWLMEKDPQISATYDLEQKDTARLELLVAACFVLAILTSVDWTIKEILWTVSIYMEAVAIMPQIFLLQRLGNCEALSSHYIACLGGYRAFYLLNWVYRYLTEDLYYYNDDNFIVWGGGIVQTLLYVDFFYYYATCIWYGTKLKLPT
eukprot:TRINITY_DN16440_c0_g4_i3.p1 TRINITY_DN16440_c0_g4~~TRINITY_DN16440_c0_g4_i3.p1  ORF type:complete len:221 (-),score=58.77 TRINITY_DN16440_c0_g4_i3:461-1123(-)